jgi:hypothetical protein
MIKVVDEKSIFRLFAKLPTDANVCLAMQQPKNETVGGNYLNKRGRE